MSAVSVLVVASCIDVQRSAPTSPIDAAVGADADPGDGPDATGCDLDCSGAAATAPPCVLVSLDVDACACVEATAADATPCHDDNPCTKEDRCASGVCGGELLSAVEARQLCDDGNPCTDDLCDVLEQCVHLTLANGATCEDGDPCTGGETCAGGQCGGADQFFCGACDPFGLDTCEGAYGDGDPCNGVLACATAGVCLTDADSVVVCEGATDVCAVHTCEPGSGECVVVPAEDGLGCSDGSACTTGDVCQGGACVGEPSAWGACSCSNDLDCVPFDDDDLCNGRVRCQSGVCLFDPGTIVACTDDAPAACTVLACNPESGVCEAGWAPDGEGCDDGDACTLGESCADGECVPESWVDCSHLAEPCVAAACDATGLCAVTVLEDGAACPAPDACHGGGECTGGECAGVAPQVCDDDDACTVDACDPATGCVYFGPNLPGCATDGVCAAGVPYECVGTSYACDPAALAGWSAIDTCGDGLDNDCDGDTDEAECAAGGCSAGAASHIYGGGMLGCGAPGLGFDEAVCATGWHVCTWSEVVARAGEHPVPKGYWLAGAVSFDPEHGSYDVTDVMDGGCQEFEGACGQARTVQAMSWPGVWMGSLSYAAEAWGCAAGVPVADCATATLDGVMCCEDTCASDAECDDGDPCTVDTCDPATGGCVHDGGAVLSCTGVGVCAAGGQATCDPEAGKVGCSFAALPGWEAVELACDGLDNDCDGTVDAADPDLVAAPGPPCEKTEGVCSGLTKDPSGHCAGGSWMACTDSYYASYDSRYTPSTELACDGADENCDGSVDEAFAYLSAAEGKAIPLGEPCVEPGVCGEGIVVCVADGSAAGCSTQPGMPGSPATAEICNALDDDCDGVADEAQELDPATSGCPELGVCASATPTCDPNGAWDCGLAALPTWSPDVDLCDGLDNDCDGEVDEDAGDYLDPVGGPPLAKGDPCGVGSCEGIVICAADGTGLVCSAAVGSDEVCDGIDNDCDDTTDEGQAWIHPETGDVHPLGGDCVGIGACAIEGEVLCSISGEAICSVQPGGVDSPAGQEVCNHLDDDCDGETDDGLGVGGPCEGEGVCGAGVLQCTGAGLTVCSTEPGGQASEAEPEVCDGLDNDCDGTVDEPAALHPLVDSGCSFVGVCTPQNVLALCQGAAGWSCDYSGAVPAGYQAGGEAGLCDGKDNDCDGDVDEDFVGQGLGQPCDGEDDDTCAHGIGVCSADGTSVACEETVHLAELCGGADEDCDGATDEAGAEGCTTWWYDGDGDGFAAPGADSACLCAPDVAEGFTATESGDCADGAPEISPAAAEVCNGVDDDCDGATDADDPLDLAMAEAPPCQDDAGVCVGVVRPPSLCVDGQWQPCDAAVYTAAGVGWEAAEASCDELDNDCDGDVDADDADLASAAPPCALQSGVCAGTLTPVERCLGGKWLSCPAAHYEDQSDDAYEHGEELSCDGLDNDCDGVADDAFSWGGAGVGASCDGEGACGAGTVECAPGGVSATCSTNPDGSAPAPSSESCNGVDDDCDGVTDEDLTALDSTCALSGVCSPQAVVATCLGGPWSCDYDAVEGWEPGHEVSCDGLDNDCDGETDDDFTAVLEDGTEVVIGDPCGSGACLGAMICDAPGLGIVCSSETAGAEVCDGEDNDCDGQVDEGLTWDGVPLGDACNGVGECGAGVVECSEALQAVCSTMPGGSTAQDEHESCNGADDDCDGETDEGYTWDGIPLGQPCVGVGACGSGHVECAADGQGATCSANPEGTSSGLAPETCNGLDDDCDGQVDEGLGLADSDCPLTGDVCTAGTVNASCAGVDGWQCEVDSPHYQAGNEDGLCDGHDNDCDGATDEDFPSLGSACDGPDDDLCAHGTTQCGIDGVPACFDAVPSPERCALPGDDDCDGEVNEAGAEDCSVFYYDGDGDGWGDAGEPTKCLCPDALVGHWTATQAGDCDDERPDVHPGAQETCGTDFADEDCDGTTDEADATGCVVFASDGDGDGWGDELVTSCLCGASAPYTVSNSAQWGDCHDGDATIHPGATEYCTAVDFDCDGELFDDDAADCTDYYLDGDGDGVGAGAAVCRCFGTPPYDATVGGDCCDDDPEATPKQDGWFEEPTACGTWDYDCNDVDELEAEDVGYCMIYYTGGGCGDQDECKNYDCLGEVGWYGVVDWGVTGDAFWEIELPECGEEGLWLVKCDKNPKGWACESTLEERVQRCR